MKYMLVLLFLISISMTIFSGQMYLTNSYIYTVKYVIIFSVVIPISIKCNVDLAKFFYCYFINKDKTI